MTKRQRQKRHENFLTRGFAKRFRQENAEALIELRSERASRKGVKRRNHAGKHFNISYSKYIASPQWKERKARYYRKHSKKCAICNSRNRVTLHHRSYKRLGRERDQDLVPLCWYHHQLFHEERGTGKLPDETDAFIIRHQEDQEARLISKFI